MNIHVKWECYVLQVELYQYLQYIHIASILKEHN